MDKYGVDLDKFKMKTGRRPKDWKKACRIAEWIHIDEMRSLLELWYDQRHFNEWKDKHGKVKPRKGEYKVYNAVAMAHRKRLCSRLQLPKVIKEIFQRPSDEDDWEKLEVFRRALVRILEGEEWAQIDREEARAIAMAVKQCTRGEFPDEVGKGCSLPEGARLQLEGGPKMEQEVIAALNGMDEGWLCFLSRPFGTKRAPLVDTFGLSLFGDKAVGEIASEQSLSAPQCFDRMLLCLFDALFLAQSEAWSNRGVANMPSDEPFEIAKYFMRGQSVGAKPLFDGLCSQCGTLLHGAVNHNSALSNKTVGPPTDRDGVVLQHDDGSPCTDAQPPFLLRFSPQLFAKEAPEMFHHDATTNRLSLREGKREPWLRDESKARSNEGPWLYCLSCHTRYIKSGKKAYGHIPYRDRASQVIMKSSASKEKVEEAQEEEPEVAAILGPEIAEDAADMDVVEEEAVPSVQLPLQATYDDEEEDESGGARRRCLPSEGRGRAGGLDGEAMAKLGRVPKEMGRVTSGAQQAQRGGGVQPT